MMFATPGVYPPEPPALSVRLDQLGFETDGPKRAVAATASAAPEPWTVTDARGRVVAHGETRPFGADPESGEAHVQDIDLSALRTPGAGYVLHVGAAGREQASRPFAVSAHPFRALQYDALGYFYETRSGIPIEARYTPRPDLARPAGHPSERVTCFKGADPHGNVWPGCDYTLDATGGWYDAGDQGKYVVNGGIAAWTLLDAYERTHGGLAPVGHAFDDGRVRIPEAGNGQNDLLDEARWEVTFLLEMQAPQGARARVPVGRFPRGAPLSFTDIDASGMAHQKLADEHWTPLPTAPQDDRERRLLYPVTTGATLNLAAVAAQCARVWRTVDPGFSARCLQAAERAFEAARRNPQVYATGDFTGSGGYGDTHLDDEFYWAEAELYATTGEAKYLTLLRASPLFLRAPGAGMEDISWGSTAGLGAVTLASIPSRLPAADLQTARDNLVAGADAYLAQEGTQGYEIPYAPAGGGWPWGSTSSLLNHALILGVAYDLTHQARYRDAVVDAMDFVLGRNPLDRSFVTGYGARPMRHPHHRFWAHQFDARYPLPPPGVISGGPNSTAMTDEVSRTMKGTCAPMTCWRDDSRAFTFNEVAINWNAPLFWTAAFLDSTEPRS